MRRTAAVLSAIFLAFAGVALEAAKGKRHRLIIWSIDGFAAGYLKHPDFQQSAVWSRLLKRGFLHAPVVTTTPSVTYPAHTSMLTGLHPAEHNILSNHSVDPWDIAKDGWTWYAEDIRGKTLWDLARAQNKTVANILWPVTMVSGTRIKYHFPQFDRAQGPEELKLMRVLSTPGLHREVENATGVGLNEHSSDAERVKAALYIWKKKQPDLMLLYNPGLDTIEHGSGPYSAAAFAHLESLGHQIEKVLNETQGDKRTAVLIVSDHGFLTYKGKCHPNVILKEMGYLVPDKKEWSYFFETAGGVARLVANGQQEPFRDKDFSERLVKTCPGIDYIAKEHADFTRLKTQYSATATAFLISRGNVHIGISSAKDAFMADATGHTHGFLPEREDMQTLALSFTSDRKVALKIRHVTDTFRFACSWLHLHCPAKKKRRLPKP